MSNYQQTDMLACASNRPRLSSGNNRYFRVSACVPGHTHSFPSILWNMSAENLDAVRTLAPDLNAQQPRAKAEELGGFKGGLRALDKCRATLVGLNADYTFNCPGDQRFFQAAGIDAEEFRRVVATGASDAEMEKWVRDTAKKE